MTRKHKLATATVLLGLGLGAAWAGDKPCRAAQTPTYPAADSTPLDPVPVPEAGLTLPTSSYTDTAAQLLAPVSLSFHDTPLRHVLADLQEQTGLTIALDTNALEEAAVDPDTPVTIEAENVSLALALSSLTVQLYLTYDLKGDGVEITVPEHSHSPRLDDVEQVIEHRLSMVVDLNFKDASLKDVVSTLKAMSELNLVLDHAALDEAGISQDQRLSLDVERMSLKSALNLLLKQIHLTYVIKDGALQITTEEHARGKLRCVTYPVADLVVPIGSGISELLPVFCRHDAEVAASHKPGTTCEEALIKLITKTIEPASWEDQGGRGTIQYFPMGHALVVVQTPDIQEQIVDLLAALQRLQEKEDREYQLVTKVVTIQSDGERKEQCWPKVTFVRGQLVRMNIGANTAAPQPVNVEVAYWHLQSARLALYKSEEALRQAYDAWGSSKAKYEAGEIAVTRHAQTRGQYEQCRADRLQALQGVLASERGLRAVGGIPPGSTPSMIGEAGVCKLVPSASQPEPVSVGSALQARLTTAGENELWLEMILQDGDGVDATSDSLRSSGHYHRLVKRVQPGKSVKLMLSQDENGTARQWVEFTVNEVPQVEEEQIFLGNLPPIPR